MNRGIGQTLASKDLTAIGERSASWELVICLMRNILCHEYCFGWSSVREMMRVSLAHFGGRHEVEQLLHLYATLVLLPPPSSSSPAPSGPDDATSSRSSSNAHQGRYRFFFFFFSFLSPLLFLSSFLLLTALLVREQRADVIDRGLHPLTKPPPPPPCVRVH